MSLTPTQIQQVDAAETRRERLSAVFSSPTGVEAMVEPERVTPELLIELGTTGVFGAEYTNNERQEILSRADELQLAVGEAVLAHETTESRGKAILDSGFGDPFQHGGQDTYHIPNSIRYGKVFLWPHVSDLGNLDRGGTILLCTVPLSNTLVSTYDAYASIYRDDSRAAYRRNRISVEEYESKYVFEYQTYLDWLHYASNDKNARVESLLPFEGGLD